MFRHVPAFIDAHFGSLWVVVGRCGSLWVVLGSLWVVVGHFGSFWVVLGGSSF